MTGLALAYDPARCVHTVPAEGRDATPVEVREYMRTTSSESGHGWTDDGMSPFFPGLNCSTCGRFVGRAGTFEVEHFEMSSEIASVDGTCAHCLDALDRDDGPNAANPCWELTT